MPGGKKTVGTIYNEAVSFLKTNYKPLLAISALYCLVSLIISTILGFIQLIAQTIIAPFSFLAFLPAMLSAKAGSGIPADAESVMSFVTIVLGLVVVAGILCIALMLVSIAALLFTYACQVVQCTVTVSMQEAALDLFQGTELQFTAKWQSFRKNWKRYLCVSAWSMLWTMLWSLLFVVPGIIKAFSYLLAPYLIIQYPELNYRQALRKSMEITNGFKGRLFVLSLVSIGFGLLGMLTFCTVIGPIAACIFWVLPLTFSMFTIAYLDIKAAAIEKGLLPREHGAGEGDVHIVEPAFIFDDGDINKAEGSEVPQDGANQETTSASDTEDSAFTEMEEDSPQL
jgi:hypothetical protein